jgi:hypothetical protein
MDGGHTICLQQALNILRALLRKCPSLVWNTFRCIGDCPYHRVDDTPVDLSRCFDQLAYSLSTRRSKGDRAQLKINFCGLHRPIGRGLRTDTDCCAEEPRQTINQSPPHASAI